MSFPKMFELCNSDTNVKLPTEFTLKYQGAEAKVYFGDYFGKPAVLKERFVKEYRHPVLDKKLTSDRMKAEGRALVKCLGFGIKCPTLYFVDFEKRFIITEQIENALSVKVYIDEFWRENSGDLEELKNIITKIGKTIAILHKNDLIHGDLTTSNMLLKRDQEIGENFSLYMIDFGLSYTSVHPEDKAVDLYVLEKVFVNTNPKLEGIFQFLLKGYFDNIGKQRLLISQKLDEVRQRGRKRSMVG